MLISKRKDAIKAGVGQYFTGKPCRNGHLANRYTQSGSCSACVAAAAAQSRGAQHSGVVIPRAQREAERTAKMAGYFEERQARSRALNELSHIRVPIYPSDIKTVFDTAIELCLAKYPALTRDDVTPSYTPVKGTPLYILMVPLEHVELVRQVGDALWYAHNKGVSGMAERVARQVEKMADDAADTPPESWK